MMAQHRRSADRTRGTACDRPALRKGMAKNHALLALVLALTTTYGGTRLAAAAAFPDSFAPLVDKVMPSVVTVVTMQVQASAAGRRQQQSPLEPFLRQFGLPGMPARPQKLSALGSGFIVDPSGLVVTNNHVIEGATDIKVTLQDGSILQATLVGHDDRTDLAVIKIDAGRPLPALAFGDSDRMKVGDWVVAVGNPFGLGGTVTAGILSARGRNLDAGPYDDFLQIDAPINEGNSGGPTFDLAGEVIGINTAILSPSGGSIGIGFAIPANVAKPIIASLEKSGHVTRGWLGVQIQPVTPELADALGLGKATGVLVSLVQAGSPAQKAGIKVGDIITAYAGRPIASPQTVTRAVADSPVGSTAALAIMRQGKATTIDVTLAELKDELSQQAKLESASTSDTRASLGLALAPLDQTLRSRLGVAGSVNGVVVLSVTAGSVAADQGMRAGDIIEQVNSHAVKQPSDVLREIDQARKTGRKAVAILLNRDGTEAFLAVPLDNG
jgi:serine protease Do